MPSVLFWNNTHSIFLLYVLQSGKTLLQEAKYFYADSSRSDNAGMYDEQYDSKRSSALPVFHTGAVQYRGAGSEAKH